MIFGSIVGVLEFLLVFACGYSVVSLICKTVEHCFVTKYVTKHLGESAYLSEDFRKYLKGKVKED